MKTVVTVRAKDGLLEEKQFDAEVVSVGVDHANNLLVRWGPLDQDLLHQVRSKLFNDSRWVDYEVIEPPDKETYDRMIQVAEENEHPALGKGLRSGYA